MRPSLLDPMFSSIRSLSGVGPKVFGLLAKVLNMDAADNEPRLVDFLHFLPHSVIDRRSWPGVAYATENSIATFELVVDRHQFPPSSKCKMPYRIFAHDHTGEIILVFFRARNNWLSDRFPPGKKILVSGKVEYFNGHATIVHPDYIVSLADKELLPLVEPVYPSTSGLSSRMVSRAVIQALGRIPVMPEWHDKALLQQEKFPSYREALYAVHMPHTPSDVALSCLARRRLAYDEFLANQLALALVRIQTRRMSERSLPLKETFTARLREHLPFQLTKSQECAFAEISRDLAAKQRMLRLLQGDVGSGKTVIALLAMAQAAESYVQSALMAPTEVLARQHYTVIKPLAEKAGLKTALLTGFEKGRERALILENLKKGNTHIIIGTHALIQTGVDYHNLAFVIIDEQHRFGVHQRLQLTSKGDAPDMLVMTATPIPRTLLLTVFGDIDVSRLMEKPAGRKPVKTAILSLDRLADLFQHVQHALERGEKIYWICPLVEESEHADLTSATKRFATLKHSFGDIVGLAHGKISSARKNAIINDFRHGKIRILVATTVVEVGVDIPDASIIIIEHAERFGLAQLHQLRGRVGRSEKSSSCTLLYRAPLSEFARKRLDIMRKTEDGFRIAREDLRLRGEGDLLGIRQSGIPDFQLADMEAHEDLLALARKDAALILQQDRTLTSQRGAALRLLLYLFRRDDTIRLLDAG